MPLVRWHVLTHFLGLGHPEIVSVVPHTSVPRDRIGRPLLASLVPPGSGTILRLPEHLRAVVLVRHPDARARLLLAVDVLREHRVQRVVHAVVAQGAQVLRQLPAVHPAPRGPRRKEPHVFILHAVRLEHPAERLCPARLAEDACGRPARPGGERDRLGALWVHLLHGADPELS